MPAGARLHLARDRHRGDTIEIRCNVIHVNGKPVASDLVDGAGRVYQDRDETFGEDATWQEIKCSRHRETLGGRSFDVFHDPDRPARDRARRPDAPGEADGKDLPRSELAPSCAAAADMGSQPAAGQHSGRLVETRPDAGPCELQHHFVVPDDSIFVLGDNRPNSNDSRHWGVVPTGNVVGRLIGVWWPLGRLGAVD